MFTESVPESTYPACSHSLNELASFVSPLSPRRYLVYHLEPILDYIVCGAGVSSGNRQSLRNGEKANNLLQCINRFWTKVGIGDYGIGIINIVKGEEFTEW